MASADIVDVHSIWVCTHATLENSTDGGQTWLALTYPVNEGCRLLDFLDKEHGWASSVSKLVTTQDGGNSWQEIILPEGIRKIAAISLQSEQDGYVLDFDRNLYSTHDGGQSWSAKELEIGDNDLALMDLNYPSAAIRFMDNDNGLVIMNLAGGGKSELLSLHTSDGGETWEPTILPVKLGSVYLSPNGEYLTVVQLGGAKIITLLQHHYFADY